MKLSFPDGLSPPTVEQRAAFYEEEFSVETLRPLFERWNHPELVLDIGSDTTRYRPRFREYRDKLVRISEYESPEELVEKVRAYAPEDVYYDRNHYSGPDQDNVVWQRPDGMELVFDLDPELAGVKKGDRLRSHIDDPLGRSYSFTEECYEETAAQTRELWQVLERHFEEVRTFFSGRGFHIHVHDDEAFQMEELERQELADRMVKKFPIDAKITTGEKEIMRLPGSLHGLTGRKVVPVTQRQLHEDPLGILYEKSRPMSFDPS